MKKLLLFIALFIPTIALSQNYPCSQSKGGINHCDGSRFVCNDGSYSKSKKNCQAVFGNSHAEADTSYSKPKNSSSNTVARDDDGRIHRSSKAKNDFKKLNPCPSTGKSTGACKGWVIGHIKPLACGGADDPSNMQWQTEAEGKAKDKWERDGCQTR